MICEIIFRAHFKEVPGALKVYITHAFTHAKKGAGTRIINQTGKETVFPPPHTTKSGMVTHWAINKPSNIAGAVPCQILISLLTKGLQSEAEN